MRKSEKELVNQFSKVMLRKLKENSHKSHWSNAECGYLMRRLYQEARELSRAMKRGDSPEEIAEEAADVANFAAMVADVSGGLEG